MEKKSLIYGVKSRVFFLFILCATTPGHCLDNGKESPRNEFSLAANGGDAIPNALENALPLNSQTTQDVLENPTHSAETARFVARKLYRGKKHHRLSSDGEKMKGDVPLLSEKAQEFKNTHHVKTHHPRKAQLKSLTKTGSYLKKMKNNHKSVNLRESFDVKENLIRPLLRINEKPHHDVATHGKKKIPNSKRSSKAHHKHHRRGQHHTRIHRKPFAQHSPVKFPHQNVHPTAFDPFHLPELEGFVLQEFHEEDFEGERLYSGHSRGDAASRKVGPSRDDRRDHISIPTDSVSGPRKGKPRKKSKKNLGKPRPNAQKDIKVKVKQFKDFDLTVLDVPSLSDNVSTKKRKHAHKDAMVRDEPARNKSMPLSNIDHRGFLFPKRTPNEAKKTISKIDVHPEAKHHISRRIGDGGDLKMMNPYGSILQSGLVKKLGDAETFKMTRDGEMVIEKPLKTSEKLGKYLHGPTAGGAGAASRYRREEGAPGSPIGAAAAAAALPRPKSTEPRPKTAEPLDYEAAHANRNTELDAEVDLDFTSIDADVMVDADVTADHLSNADVGEVTATPYTVLELSSTTFSPDVMPSISCANDQDCGEVQEAVCGEDGTCECPAPTPVYIADISRCLKGAALNTSCEYDEQCLYMEDLYGRCGPKKICTCVQGYEVKMHPNVGINCVERSSSVNPVDPTMIGVLVGLALMFIIICVVLRLFSKARFRENRSIFNTPNPRLMNASMFKDSKLLSPSRGDRRGSRASVRVPSRTASLASVNATSPINKSPNGSLTAKGRRGSGVSVGSGPVGSPPTSALARTSPTPETPKSGSATSPDKNKKDQSTVNIEAVD